MDDVAVRATDLAEQSLVIGWVVVALLVGAAAVGAGATYVVAQKKRKNKKAAETSGPSET